jgi:hypothetical protein
MYQPLSEFLNLGRLTRKVVHDVGRFPSPKPVTVLVTPVVLPGRGIVQVVDNKVVGDTGFEPVTSTV